MTDQEMLQQQQQQQQEQEQRERELLEQQQSQQQYGNRLDDAPPGQPAAADWPQNDGRQRQQGQGAQPPGRGASGQNWGNMQGAPLLEGGKSNKSGKGRLIAAACALLLAGAAGGFYVLHGHSGSSSKRLPGMGQMADMLPFAKAEKHPSKAVLPASATLAAQQVKPADPALASLGQTASAPVAGLAQPVEPGAERLPPVAGLDEPSASAAPAAIAPTAAAASSAERGAIPTLDSDGIVYLDEHKKVAGVILGNKDRDGLTDPGDADDYASGAGSGNGDVRILQRALARLQDKVATLEARMPDAGAATRVSGASANTDSSLRQTQRAKRERLARDRRWAEREYAAHVAAQAAIAAASASAPAPAPTLGAQLLSVDMWGGTPSVVVTSGLPDDKRIRTLRPGDTLNGVTLQSADPATGSATFSSDGKSFTLSTRTGG